MIERKSILLCVCTIHNSTHNTLSVAGSLSVMLACDPMELALQINSPSQQRQQPTNTAAQPVHNIGRKRLSRIEYELGSPEFPRQANNTRATT